MITPPRYPVYVPSKGRTQLMLTARFLLADGVPFHLVVEPQEAEQYAAALGSDEQLLILPKDNGGLLFARNWIREHSIAAGHTRHWQLDDNISDIRRLCAGGHRIPCAAGPALRVCEDFTDRYINVGVSGLNYYMFGLPNVPPFVTNVHVYSCTLINNQMPYRWRERYNDDTDLCLQVLSGGLCTILLNAFLARKMRTMIIRGGNTDDLYQGDGRLRMARALERRWPHVVKTDRRFQRPQHIVRDAWRKFDTPLIPRPDLDLTALPETDEYGLQLHAVREVRSPDLRKLLDEALPSEDGQT